jgi:hypothetical protein
VLTRRSGGVVTRGVRNGSFVSLVLFGIATALVTVLLTGHGLSIVSNFSFSDALTTGLVAGGILGFGYFALGVALVIVGLVFRAKPDWITAGAWAAVPVVVIAIGFGTYIYRAIGT